MAEWKLVSGVGEAQNLVGSMTKGRRQTPNTHMYRPLHPHYEDTEKHEGNPNLL